MSHELVIPKDGIPVISVERPDGRPIRCTLEVEKVRLTFERTYHGRLKVVARAR